MASRCLLLGVARQAPYYRPRPAGGDECRGHERQGYKDARLTNPQGRAPPVVVRSNAPWMTLFQLA